MPPLKLGVLASGRGSNLQAILDAQASGKIVSKVALVVSDVPGSTALERAKKAGAPGIALAPDASLKGPERRAQHEAEIEKVLRAHGVDLVVLAGYMRILTPRLLQAFPDRVVNVHPSLLPSFPGVESQRQALEWGAKIAGCTTHLVDADVDHGPILLQAALTVRPDDTYESLATRILKVEHQLLPRTVQLFEEGRVKLVGRRVQIEPGPSWKTKYPMMPDVLYGEGY